MNAQFSSTPPASCGNCEYRQYVQGEFSFVGLNGNVYNPDKYLAPGVLLSHSTLQEDGGYLSGGWTRYGHRSDPTPPTWTNVIDSYGSDRLTGCTYLGSDAPDTGCQSSGVYSQVGMTLYFVGQIIDTTTGTAVATKSWNVICQATG
jgi:hypothetical protein